MRRNAISPFFSKRSVQALEGLVVNNTKKLLSRLHGELGKKGPDAGIVNLNNAYAGFTMDIISEYCFGESMKSLEKEEYGKEWLDIFHQGIQIEPLARQFPTICNLMLDLPPYIVAKLDAGVAKISSFNEQMLSKIERILRREDDKDSSRNLKRTIFHDIRDDVGGKLPESEKQPKRLMVEATVVLAAGTETTAKTMAITTFYLIKNTEAGEKLRRELKTVMPTVDHQVTLPQLEALPYLVSILLHSIHDTILTRNLDGSDKRRPACRTPRLLPATPHRHGRRPPVRTIHPAPRNPRHGIRLPPPHRSYHLPRPLLLPS
jgi:cytochrome P450